MVGWGSTTPMLGSMPSLLTPWISSNVSTGLDDLKLWGPKRQKTAHTPQVGEIIFFLGGGVFVCAPAPFDLSIHERLLICNLYFMVQQSL